MNLYISVRLFQCPLCAFLGVLDLDAESLEVVTDAVAGSPVLRSLCGLALLEDHVHETVDGLEGLSALRSVLVTKSEDSEYDVVEEVYECLVVGCVKSDLPVLCCVDDTDCIEDMRECDRCVEVVNVRTSAFEAET